MATNDRNRQDFSFSSEENDQTTSTSGESFEGGKPINPLSREATSLRSATLTTNEQQVGSDNPESNNPEDLKENA